MPMTKRVLVSGCYDLLHSGHVAFFREAASYGDLYVGIGSDATIRELKGRETVNSEAERLFMVRSIRYVTDAFVNAGSGLLDFEPELRRLRPDLLIVNEDGNSPAKAALCAELGVEYKVLRRVPEPGLAPRSTTALRGGDHCLLPYRLDLAGTWIDQPYVSKHGPGWALTISLEPVIEYNERSGMASSTRNAARRLWPIHLPLDHPEKLAEALFRYENPPGRKEVSGAQDAIGICVPGLSRHYYEGDYWPGRIERCDDEEVLAWLEDHLSLITLWPRPPGLDLLGTSAIDADGVRALTEAAEAAWPAIMDRDLPRFAHHFRDSFDAQIRMFPAMMNDRIQAVIDSYRETALAWKLAGAGGGGYLVLLAESPIPNAMRLHIRRKGTH